MTNTVFFSAINRDDETASSSSRSETSEPPQTEAQASLSAYSVIGKAWLACARPQLEADEDVDDSTANTSAAACSTHENESVMEDLKLKSISYMELKTATSKFRTSNILGSGDSGCVFKGWINENTLAATASGKGIAVAVKRLHRGSAGTVAKWLKEIHDVGRFHHPNLVRTLAYCTEGEQPMVVYEFMPRGSLADHLFRRGSDAKPLSWRLRLKIALGAAKCLDFLHRNKAVHGNIRPSNILLDSYYNSKLSFGVARDCPVYIETVFGERTSPPVNEYTPPECILRGYLTARGDIYSFGVVLLEMLVGRKVTKSELIVETLSNAGDQLAEVNNDADQLVPFLDRSFRGDKYAMEDARLVLKLAMLCMIRKPHSRITMDLAVEALTMYMDRCSEGEEK